MWNLYINSRRLIIFTQLGSVWCPSPVLVSSRCVLCGSDHLQRIHLRYFVHCEDIYLGLMRCEPKKAPVGLLLRTRTEVKSFFGGENNGEQLNCFDKLLIWISRWRCESTIALSNVNCVLRLCAVCRDILGVRWIYWQHHACQCRRNLFMASDCLSTRDSVLIYFGKKLNY